MVGWATPVTAVSCPLQKWLDGLEEELFAQGDFEASIGLPITPFMDRALPGISSRQAGTGLWAEACMHATASLFIGPAGPQDLVCRPGMRGTCLAAMQLP